MGIELGMEFELETVLFVWLELEFRCVLKKLKREAFEEDLLIVIGNVFEEGIRGIDDSIDWFLLLLLALLFVGEEVKEHGTNG